MLITIKAELPQQQEEQGNEAPANAPNLFDQFVAFVGNGNHLVIEKCSLGTNVQYAQAVPLDNVDIIGDLNDPSYLAQWYAALLEQHPDEFVLYMGNDEYRQNIIGGLLHEHLAYEQDDWQIGNFRICLGNQEHQIQNDNRYQLTCLRVELSGIQADNQ